MQKLEPYGVNKGDTGIYFTDDPAHGVAIKAHLNDYLPSHENMPAFNGTVPNEFVKKHTDIVLRELAAFKHLETLSIPHLPADDQGLLSKLPHLNHLVLHRRFDEPVVKAVTDHSSIDSLSLSRCGVSVENLQKLSLAKNLKHLTITGPRFGTDPNQNQFIHTLATLVQLESLELAEMELAPDALKRLAVIPLKRLKLRKIIVGPPNDTFQARASHKRDDPHHYSTLLAPLGEFSQLEQLEIEQLYELHLRFQPQAPLPMLGSLVKLPQLKRVTIIKTEIHPDDVAEISKLKEVEFVERP